MSVMCYHMRDKEESYIHSITQYFTSYTGSGSQQLEPGHPAEMHQAEAPAEVQKEALCGVALHMRMFQNDFHMEVKHELKIYSF